jgi:NAD(P)-dependent dehydrogenase (short-subunit alcohol dehydrogenase family)
MWVSIAVSLALLIVIVSRPDTLLSVWFGRGGQKRFNRANEQQNRYDNNDKKKGQREKKGPGRKGRGKRLAVLVTGCSSGIGREAADRLASSLPRFSPQKNDTNPFDPNEPFLVLAGLRSVPRVGDDDDVGRFLEGKVPVELDVSDPQAVGTLADRLRQVLEEHNALLCAVVSNAGTVMTRPVSEHDPAADDLRSLFETNVFGAVGVVNAVLPLLRDAAQTYHIVPRIVYTTSVLGSFNLPLLGAYAGSKHALQSIATSQRIELAASDGFFVSTLEPSNVLTRFGEQNVRRLASRGGPWDHTCRAFAEWGSLLGARDATQSANAIVHAVSAPPRSVRARYPVGPEALLLPVVEALLPTALYDWIHRFCMWGIAEAYSRFHKKPQ